MVTVLAFAIFVYGVYTRICVCVPDVNGAFTVGTYAYDGVIYTIHLVPKHTNIFRRCSKFWTMVVSGYDRGFLARV